MEKVLKKKSMCFGSYEEFVFTENKKSEKSRLHVGSRPFETKISYLNFLDTFISVSFSHVLERMEQKGKDASIPFLRYFAKDIVDREMSFFVKQVSGSNQKKYKGLSVLSGDVRFHQGRTSRDTSRERSRNSVPGRTSSPAFRHDVGTTRPAAISGVGRPVGLFRGKSMIENRPERSTAAVKRFVKAISLSQCRPRKIGD